MRVGGTEKHLFPSQSLALTYPLPQPPSGTGYHCPSLGGLKRPITGLITMWVPPIYNLVLEKCTSTL